jgi:hypothetical protein
VLALKVKISGFTRLGLDAAFKFKILGLNAAFKNKKILKIATKKMYYY